MGQGTSNSERDAGQPDAATLNYPTRDGFFAHAFVRELHRREVAKQIGRTACYLLCVIAHAEDEHRYAGPVEFWNSELMATMGFTSPKQLDTARDEAVKSGWLVYSRAGTRSVGRYFVTIPQSMPIHSPDGTNQQPDQREIHSQNGTNSGTNHGAILSAGGKQSGKQSGKPSLPIPVPAPSPWAAVVEKHKPTIGTIQELADEAQQRGQTVAEFCKAVDDAALATAALPVNASKLTNPGGAVVTFLRTGTWPAHGVVSLDDHQRELAAKQAAEERRREQARKSAEEMAQSARERAELAELNARCGAQLDVLDAVALQTLADSAGISLPSGPLARFGLSVLRLPLLRELDRQTQSQTMEAVTQ